MSSNVTICVTGSVKGPQLLMSSSLVRTAIVLSEKSLWSIYYWLKAFFCRLSSRDPKHNRLIFKWINIFSVKRPFVRVLFTPKPLCTLRFTYGTVCHWSVSHLVEGFLTKNGEKITHLIHIFLSFSILIILICDHTKIPCDHLFFLMTKYSNIQIPKYLG